MGRDDDPLDRLLGEQIDYFDARVPEYDASMEPDATDPEFTEWRAIRDLVRNLGLSGDVVDLAAGTGKWTELFYRDASSVTLVDASPQALEIAARRLAADHVSYVAADLFTWQPERQYDVVFSSFWLCHVPPALVTGFIEMVAGACRAGGRLVLVDEHNFDDPGLEVAAAAEEDAWVSHRGVRDGRRFRLVKVRHNPEEIERQLTAGGWRTSLDHHGEYFYVLSATRSGR